MVISPVRAGGMTVPLYIVFCDEVNRLLLGVDTHDDHVVTPGVLGPAARLCARVVMLTTTISGCSISAVSIEVSPLSAVPRVVAHDFRVRRDLLNRGPDGIRPDDHIAMSGW